MAIFKCKMCGGDLEVAEGMSIAECEYCGTNQTVASSNDENLQGLYNRANTLRIKSEFDKAERLYEKIIQVDSTQSEAYWGIILCRYGIEYVEDPKTFKRIPTCHRASFDSVVADDDYKSAIKNADMIQRRLYESEAQEIDRIQKEILSLSQKEEPYDVFICYKETDSSGSRTQDSVIANDIYYELTNEGFKVFYAAITLEDKLGSAYEPCIFAALNSAKVMLVIGTKPENFNAVWVKNEWSRYLKIMKKDRSRTLIPCFRDMDAYELPDEFAHLQAQDMSKIGFINDIVRGIQKLVKVETPKQPAARETSAAAGNATIAPLLKRVFMFLEDGDWESADEYCEKVLDIEPECAEAYLGKVMAQFRVNKREEIKSCEGLTRDNRNYQKAIFYSDNETKAQLEEYLKYAVNNTIYKKAIHNIGLNDTAALEVAIELLERIPGWRDADELVQKYKEKLCEAIEAENEAIYQKAVTLGSRDYVGSLYNAIDLLKEIPDWKDSSELMVQYRERVKRLEGDIKKSKLKERQRILSKDIEGLRDPKYNDGCGCLFPGVLAPLIIAVILIIVYAVSSDGYFDNVIPVAILCLIVAAVSGTIVSNERKKQKDASLDKIGDLKLELSKIEKQLEEMGEDK